MQKKPSQTTMSLYEKKYNHLIKKIGFDDQKLLNELKLFNPDFVINCFCNFKFEKILKNFETYNVHLSFLPQYRGRHPFPSDPGVLYCQLELALIQGGCLNKGSYSQLTWALERQSLEVCRGSPANRKNPSNKSGSERGR